MLKVVAEASEIDDASSVCDPRINNRLKAQVKKVYDMHLFELVSKTF